MANPNPNQATRFQKGQPSPNPGGRPKGKHLTTLLFEALKKKAKNDKGKEIDKTYQDLLIERILKDAIGKGNTSLIHLVMNYIDGQPEQYIDHTTNGESLNSHTSDEVMEIAKRVSAELKKKKTG